MIVLWVIKLGVSVVAAYLTSKIAFIVYPQIHPMCVPAQSWTTCVSTLDFQSLFFDVATIIACSVFVCISMLLNFFWPRAKEWSFFLPMSFAAGIVSLLELTSQIQFLDEVYDSSGVAVLLLGGMFLGPYIIGLVSWSVLRP